MTQDKHLNQNALDIVILFRAFAKSWRLICLVTVLAFLLSVLYALMAQEIYKSEILLATVEPETPSITSSLGNIGGLAALSGISIPADSDEIEVLATIQSSVVLNCNLVELQHRFIIKSLLKFIIV